MNTLDLICAYMRLAELQDGQMILRDLTARYAGYPGGAHLPKDHPCADAGARPTIAVNFTTEVAAVHFPVVVDSNTNEQYGVTYHIREALSGMSITVDIII